MIKFRLSVIILLVLFFHSCMQTPSQSDRKLRILTTIPPLYSFTKNVVQDLAYVDNLLPSGVGPHDYSLSPGDALKVSSSNMLVLNGINLETWVGKIADTLDDRGRTRDDKKSMPVLVDTSARISVIGNDPHIWLSPLNAIIQVENIRDALIIMDPENADEYKINAEKYINRLRRLDKDIRDEIKEWMRKEIVALHSAFAYFARDYGIDVVAVLQQSPEIEPTAKEIAGVMQIIETKGIKAIFNETSSSNKIVESIARDLDLEVFSLDTIEKGDLSEQWYEEKMRANLKVMHKAVSIE